MKRCHRGMSSYLYISTRLDIDVSSGLTHWGIPHMSELHPCIGLPAATTVNTSQPHSWGGGGGGSEAHNGRYSTTHIQVHIDEK